MELTQVGIKKDFKEQRVSICVSNCRRRREEGEVRTWNSRLVAGVGAEEWGHGGTGPGLERQVGLPPAVTVTSRLDSPHPFLLISVPKMACHDPR